VDLAVQRKGYFTIYLHIELSLCSLYRTLVLLIVPIVL